MKNRDSGSCPFFILLLAVCLIGAGEEQAPEDPPDLHEESVSGQPAEDRAKITADLKKRSDQALRSELDTMLARRGFRMMVGYEPCLNELLQRDREQSVPYLKKKVEALMKQEIKPYENADYAFPGAMYNLELLTALRRAQGKPDPLHITIEGPKQIEAIGSDLPALRVAIKNVDHEKTSVGFTVGGDYRSGRQARWRILLEDEHGKAMPVREHLGFIGGGLFGHELLEHGGSWKTTLAVRSFIEVPPPGQYQLTVLYHNTQTIAGSAHTDGLIVSRSDPIRLTVKPLTIVYSKADRKTVRRLVAELDGGQALKIIAGTYGPWAHKLIPPDSPGGELLGMGLKAVPTLIDSLNNKSLSDGKRAWLLGILYSLTSEIDPRDNAIIGGKGSALGSYEYWESGWQIWGGQEGDALSGGFSPGSRGSVSGPEIDRKTQDRFIDAWKDWIKKAEVKEAEEEDEP